MTENMGKLNLPLHNSISEQRNRDKRTARAFINMMLTVYSSACSVEKLFANTNTYSTYIPLLKSLVSFGIQIKRYTDYFYINYRINHQIPRDLQDVLDEMNDVFDHVQAHLLSLRTDSLGHLTSDSTIQTDEDKGIDVINEHKNADNAKGVDDDDRFSETLTIVNEPQQGLFKYYDTEQVEKYKHSLLEIKEVDAILLEKLPTLTTKYSKVINDIRRHAIFLSIYKVQPPKLILLLELSKQNFSSINSEISADLYKGYDGAAEKLKESIANSMLKVQEVVQEHK